MGKLVQGVGVYESGTFPAYIERRATRLYELWSKMLLRCYSDKMRHKHRSYGDCSVSEEFKRFQTFAAWAVEQVGFHEGFHLDKDLLSTGDKVYSPQVCVFVPNVINNLALSRKSARGNFPVGVNLHKLNGTYTAAVSVGHHRLRKAGFTSPEDAFLFYKLHKERIARELAQEYKGRIDCRIYDKLMQWEVNIED